MNVLIVYAHPEPLSLNGALKDVALDALTSAGHRVAVSDLYAMRFNPVGEPADSSSEVAAELQKLVWADLLVFQFPLWWSSLPAILKGWVDRVFATTASGSFRGKRAMLSFTTGGTASNIDEIMQHVQYGMFHYVGMEVLPPFIVHGAAPGAPRERHLDSYRERLLSLDGLPAIQFDRAA
jgi:NAD(P)H dehydrogenase (quinone)